MGIPLLRDPVNRVKAKNVWRKEKEMRKAEVNFWLDLLLFLSALGLAVSGFVRWLILPGSGGYGFHGGRGALASPAFIFPRATWVTLHKFLSVAFLCLMVIHIVLHWDWIACMFRSLLRK